MTQKGHEEPVVSREVKSDSSSFYKQGDQPPIQSSESSYEQYGQPAAKGVLSLSRAFESKSVQPSPPIAYPDTSVASRSLRAEAQATAQRESRRSEQVYRSRDEERTVPMEKATFSMNRPGYSAREQEEQGYRLSYDRSQAASYVRDQGQRRMQFHVPGSHAYDMTAFVVAPSGAMEHCQVVDLDDSNYSIKFVPRETGNHSVSVKHKGIDIPGSPFEFFVGPVAGGGARSIQAYGAGLSGGYANERCEFEIFTREAGAGSLSVAVEGPVKSEIDFSDKKDGTCVVSYICPEPGEYKISIKFNDQHVPGSPFVAHITGQYGDQIMPRMCLGDLAGDRGQTNKPMSFTVDMTGRKGRLEAYVTSPTGSEELCTLHEGPNNSYSIRFTPSQSGIHWVHVRYNGREIPDSPFRVPVSETICDPSKVFASGVGLYHGEVGKACQFYIDTSAAGSGALSVTVDGPSKVDIDCVESGNGYQSSFIPTQPGIYVVIIKFADVQIAGSPFHCKVYDTTQPGGRPLSSRPMEMPPSRPIHLTISDEEVARAEKVVAYGTGLSHAFVNEDAHFTVDTQSAGRSVLTISIQGPRKPNRDIEVRRCGDNLYDVCYNLPQPGTYHLTVKWADRHIVGSPFTISVA